MGAGSEDQDGQVLNLDLCQRQPFVLAPCESISTRLSPCLAEDYGWGQCSSASLDAVLGILLGGRVKSIEG